MEACSVGESSLDEAETEMLEEISMLAALEPEGFTHLCGLCGMEVPEEAFRDGGSEEVPESRE